MDTLAALKQIDELKDVPEEQLNWLINNSEFHEIKQGETMFSPGDPINRLFIILDGDFTLRLKRNNQFVNVGRLQKYTITGMLPYSRAQSARAYAEALSDSAVISLDEALFKEMIRDHHELTTVFVHAMSTRIRQFTKQEQQDDKMMALGKLSAGLAHELNNPSAAVVRSSKELSKLLKISPEKFKNVIKIKISDEEIDRITTTLFQKIDGNIKEMNLIEKSSLEDELIDWLDDHAIEDADELAANFVDFGITEDDLESFSEAIPDSQQNAIFSWLNQVFKTEKLVSEIEDASQRINDLVSSIKSYTHMDQAPEKTPTDIHVGLNNTLTMLNHKLKDVKVVKNYAEDLPKATILASPLNQVWTNLIDNAIDAMEDQAQKQLTISTKKEGEFLNIKIEDSGTGIPKEIQDKIFDPFFTTKGIGKGTGLGLEFVQQIIKVQHKGAVYLESEPGKTIFTICLPITEA